MDFDQSRYLKKYQYYIGCDEVGRGPLAGPVVSCSVMTSQLVSFNDFSKSIQTLFDLGIGDSKKLSSSKRKKIIEKLSIDLKSVGQSKIYQVAIKNITYSFSISIISNILVDRLNILNASLESMKRSIENLISDSLKDQKTIFSMIDGNKIPKNLAINSEFVIKGDQKSLLIGMASIIAKEWRDLYMKKMSTIYQNYGFEKHSGYPTKFHREAIKKMGITNIHRKTFNGCHLE